MNEVVSSVRILPCWRLLGLGGLFSLPINLKIIFYNAALSLAATSLQLFQLPIVFIVQSASLTASFNTLRRLTRVFLAYYTMLTLWYV